MRIRPHITLLFLISVFTVLFFISVFFFTILPKEKDSFSLFGGLKISFFKPSEIFTIKEQYADISEIIKQNRILNDSVDEFQKTDSISVPRVDTIRVNADSLKRSIRKLEFPRSKRNILFPVFKAMERAKETNNVVRIMHFGDSQIEGDRITSFIRSKLQNKFGGSGVGLIPARQIYDFKYSVFHEASDNWHRYTLYGRKDTLIKHKRYGILASFNSFTKQPIDTFNTNTSLKRAWISIEESPYSYKNTKKFEQCRFFYGHNRTPFKLKLFADNEIADSGTFSPTNKLKQLHWMFSQPISSLYFDFEGILSPEVYAIALDGKSGIAVDNIAMRGCAGLVFNKTDPDLFRKLIDMLDVKLIIMQFGGNMVPNIRKNYSFYERWFYTQLKFIRSYAPDVQIIVIGVADMSIKKGTRYVSYPNIELIRDAMKKATFKAGAIYWDMYEAMGGKNSMPSWVFAQPALAGKDFVHFNPRGAKIIANMFYNALMHEYRYYKEKRN